MKKKLSLLALSIGIFVFSAGAQQVTKEKPITTPKDKVHNTIHPNNKVSHGTKYKHKTASGKKTVTAVKTDHTVPMDTKKKVETTK
ncbi:MAG: hypothetical protein ABI480_11655 [Chitinophagaceae bacterium]